MVDLDTSDFSPFCSSQAKDVAADGSVVVGARDFGAFRWSADDGAVYLGDLPGGPLQSTAKGVSGDGSVVVGASYSGSGPEAFLWDAPDGIRSLRAVLVDDYGLDLSGWILTTAEDISRDGRTIVGSGINPDGVTEAWIATLPSTDCNANGVPDECDIVNSVSGDCNADAILDECQPEFDSDGDGFLDPCDACDQSNMDDTLLIGSCDTGINNVTDSEGCTLADRLASACPLPAEVNSRGRFVECIARLANEWRQEGLISSGESGRIVACSAHRSNPDRH